MPAAHSRPPPLFCKQTRPMLPRPPGTGPTAAKSLAASHLQKPEASARNTCRLATRNGPYGNAKTAVLPANTTNEGATPRQGRHYASIAQPGATAAAQWHRASHTHKKRHGRKRPPQQDRAGNGPSTDKLPCKTQQPWPAHSANATELVWQKTTALWQTALGCMAEKAAQWQKTVCKSLDFQSVESGKLH